MLIIYIDGTSYVITACMIRSYLTIAFRNFLRNRTYTLINVLGLSIGITSCVIIFLLITNDLSFDKFHLKYDRIYRVVLDSKSGSGLEQNTTTPYPFADAFRNDFPAIPLMTQFHLHNEAVMRIETEKHRVSNVLFADSVFFNVFDFKVLSGNPYVDLGEPGKVFLTKSLADKIMNGKETATIKLNNKTELEVVGIIADPPPNSHINFSMVASRASLTPEFIGFPLDSWGMTMSAFTYIVLPSGSNASLVEEQLGTFGGKYFSQEDKIRKTFKLQALSEIHFDDVYTENPGTGSNANVSDLTVMAILGLFILAIACMNFINLATALAVKKSKEIGIRKTLGAKRAQLSFYFLGETFLLTLFSVIISLCVVEWLLRWLNNFLEISLELNLLSNPLLILFLVSLIFVTTVLAGFYPAIVLSGFNPLAVLKNKMAASGSSGTSVRKVLVVFQFMIAQILIMGTLIIANQMSYFREKDLGFDGEAVITVSIPENKPELMESFRARLNGITDIKKISFSLGAPTSDNNFTTNFFVTEKGPQELYKVAIKPADRHYLDTYGLKLIAGRWFTEADERAATKLDDKKAEFVYIINEAAVRQLGFNNPSDIIGKKITTGIGDLSKEVVGVVQDFHTSSLRQEIEPVILMNISQFYYEAGIKVSAENLSKTISATEGAWSEVFPEYNFEYAFLDDYLMKLYQHDDRTFTLFKIFAAISIFIGCLGLYGLISFIAAQKLKEVGIRKVLGASVTSIMVLFSREFVKLIVVAFLIAAPLAWYFMNQWLEGFAYHTSIPWTVYVIGIVSTLLIALITVSYRSAQAAISNPAETLRTE